MQKPRVTPPTEEMVRTYYPELDELLTCVIGYKDPGTTYIGNALGKIVVQVHIVEFPNPEESVVAAVTEQDEREMEHCGEVVDLGPASRDEQDSLDDEGVVTYYWLITGQDGRFGICQVGFNCSPADLPEDPEQSPLPTFETISDFVGYLEEIGNSLFWFDSAVELRLYVVKNISLPDVFSDQVLKHIQPALAEEEKKSA